MIIHDLFSNFLFSRRARSLGDGSHRGGIEGGVEEVIPLNITSTP
jgi:hypothetical protein